VYEIVGDKVVDEEEEWGCEKSFHCFKLKELSCCIRASKARREEKSEKGSRGEVIPIMPTLPD